MPSKYDRLIPQQSQIPEPRSVYRVDGDNNFGDLRKPSGRSRIQQTEASNAIDPANVDALAKRQRQEDIDDTTHTGSTTVLGSQLKDRFGNSIQTGYTGGEQQTHQIENSVATTEDWKNKKKK